MTGLTESLLALARADADALGMTMQPTDLNELADSVVGQSGAVGRRHRASPCAPSLADQPVEASADPIRRSAHSPHPAG